VKIKQVISDAGGLVTKHGIAKEAGVTRQAVSRWIERPDFPTPVAQVDGWRDLWLMDEVRAYLKTREES
jgi:hypothetical protein